MEELNEEELKISGGGASTTLKSGYIHISTNRKGGNYVIEKGTGFTEVWSWEITNFGGASMANGVISDCRVINRNLFVGTPKGLGYCTIAVRGMYRGAVARKTYNVQFIL